LVFASALAASLASAQEGANPVKVEQDQAPSRNRFGLSYRMGFNITAKFKNLGGYPALANPNMTPNGAAWNYDDGYNFDDGPGTPPGQTWYWGYAGPKATQVPGDGNLYLSRSSAGADVSTGGKTDDPQQPGFEFTYNRDLGALGSKARWGVEGAFNFMNVSIHDNRTLFGSVTKQTDAYALNGVVPPDPPYYGTFEGPVPGGPNRPVISDTPIPQAPTTIANGATIVGDRKIDADIYGFRVGPYVEIPLSQKFALSLSGGLAVASVHGDFKFNETVSIPGVGSVASSGSGSRTDWLFGGYAGANLSYAFNKSWSAAIGAQYQNVGRFSEQVGGKRAELDLSNSIFVTVGIGYSF
jgi:hypothetical protein